MSVKGVPGRRLSAQSALGRAALTEEEQRALSEYQDFLLRRFPRQIERLVLFGSRARGDAAADSDIDVLVLLRKRVRPNAEGFYPLGLTDPVWQEVVGTTFDLLVKYGVEISPTVMTASEYEERSPLMSHIREEGIELWRRSD